VVFLVGVSRIGMDACAVFAGGFDVLKAEHGVDAPITDAKSGTPSPAAA
jgi:hypothetical protein